MKITLLLTIVVLLFTPLACGETLTVPGNIEEIEEEAFYGVTAPDALTIAEGVLRLGERAFAGGGFSRVVLPASLVFLADSWLSDVNPLVVQAPEASPAWDWGVRLGFIEKTSFAVSPAKDFVSFAAAREMVDTACLSEWSGAGRIRYVEQFGGTRTYVPEYWVSQSDASGSCTRAAGSMAASYMGVNALPRVASSFTAFQAYIKAQGFTVATDNDCSLSVFVRWYDDYARDVDGAFSPVVIYTEYGLSRHAFVVIGRDAEAHDLFYIADSGSTSYVNRVRLAEEDGLLYVAQYEFADGRVDERYGKDHPMVYFWRYCR